MYVRSPRYPARIRDLPCGGDEHAWPAWCGGMAEIHVGAIWSEGEQLRGVVQRRDLMRRVVLERLDPSDGGQES